MIIYCSDLCAVASLKCDFFFFKTYLYLISVRFLSMIHISRECWSRMARRFKRIIECGSFLRRWKNPVVAGCSYQGPWNLTWKEFPLSSFLYLFVKVWRRLEWSHDKSECIYHSFPKQVPYSNRISPWLTEFGPLL